MGRTYDRWMSSTRGPRRLPNAERDQMPLIQAHAFDHYLGGWCGGRFPIDRPRPKFQCPLCLRWQERSAFTPDHAPQRGEQSRLGPTWITVLTCICNQKANLDFEREASVISASGIVDHRTCPVHGDVALPDGFDASFMASVQPVTLADVKSAYLLAFAVLGYSWCTSPRLAGLRGDLTAGRPIASYDALVTCGLASPTMEDRSVILVAEPIPLVLVVGPERSITVALPTDGTPDVLVACELASRGPLAATTFRWPLMVRETARALDREASFMKPEEAWDNGHLFHLDRCDRPHVGATNRHRAGTRILSRAGRPTGS